MKLPVVSSVQIGALSDGGEAGPKQAKARTPAEA